MGSKLTLTNGKKKDFPIKDEFDIILICNTCKKEIKNYIVKEQVSDKIYYYCNMNCFKYNNLKIG